MFHKLHYYDGFYLDGGFWDFVSGKARMRRRGMSRALGEMMSYGPWHSERNLFLWNYEWCKSHHVTRAFRPSMVVRTASVLKTVFLEYVYLHWNRYICFCENDARCMAAEEPNNPIDRLACDLYCFVDAEKNNYARFYFDETGPELDGYAIELAVLFSMQLEKDEFGGKTAYTFKCAK